METDVLQPLLDWFSLFNSIATIFCFGIGFLAAFRYQNFMQAILLPIVLLFFASAFSGLAPDALPGIMNYIWTLVIGFIVASVVKWVGKALLGF